MPERMRQMSEHRWSFEPPAEAPMRGDCPACQRSVVVRQPRCRGQHRWPLRGRRRVRPLRWPGPVAGALMWLEGRARKFYLEVVFTHQHDGHRHQHDQFFATAREHELAHRLERRTARAAKASRPRG